MAARVMRRAVTAVCFVVGCAAAAFAQQAPPPAPGAFIIEPIENAIVLAPEVKVTDVNGKVGTLAGGYGGWVSDTQFLVGGAGYWLTDRKDDTRNLAYGGLLVGWFFDPGQAISVSARTLVGLGRISGSTVAFPFCDLPEPFLCTKRPTRADALVGHRVRFHHDFPFAEPEIDVLARLSRRVSLSGGAGYRLASEADRLDLHPGGATGTFSVQFKF